MDAFPKLIIINSAHLIILCAMFEDLLRNLLQCLSMITIPLISISIMKLGRLSGNMWQITYLKQRCL